MRFSKPTPRKNVRQVMRRAVWLTFDGCAAPVPCVVWDFSPGGCRLAAPHATRLPKVFALATSPDAGPEFFCRIVWQKGGYVGVKFVAASEAERLVETLPDDRPGGLYWKNDRASWEEAESPAAPVAKPKPRPPRKRPKFNIQLY
jgi:hypothetical protein